jgi:hypothetical protein
MAGSNARPGLERLEHREAPTFFATSTTITSIGQTYDLFSQHETVNVQVNSSPPGITTISLGAVTITDNGQTQTATISSLGQASASFAFPLLGGANPQAHTVTASFSNSGTLFGDSSTSTTAGNTQGQFLFVLFFDALLIQAALNNGTV